MSLLQHVLLSQAGRKEWNQEIRQKNGAGEGTRTLDVHLDKVTLYQLSYART